MLSATVVALGACGGDGGSANDAGTDGGAPLPRAESESQVKKACVDLMKLDTAQRPGEEVEAYVNRTAPRIKEIADRLPTVEQAPDDIAEEYRRFMEVRNAAFALIRDIDPDSDAAAIAAVAERGRKLADESDRATDALGYDECKEK